MCYFRFSDFFEFFWHSGCGFGRQAHFFFRWNFNRKSAIYIGNIWTRGNDILKIASTSIIARNGNFSKKSTKNVKNRQKANIEKLPIWRRTYQIWFGYTSLDLRYGDLQLWKKNQIVFPNPFASVWKCIKKNQENTASFLNKLSKNEL